LATVSSLTLFGMRQDALECVSVTEYVIQRVVFLSALVRFAADHAVFGRVLQNKQALGFTVQFNAFGDVLRTQVVWSAECSMRFLEHFAEPGQDALHVGALTRETSVQRIAKRIIGPGARRALRYRITFRLP
jgi:hypothetical protein